MSVSKPAIQDVRWGVDGSNADATNVVSPTSGARDTGWALNQIPTSGVENYLKNRPYRWFQFIDEVFKVAGTAVADLKISGQATFGGALAVISGGAAITGNSNVNGTLAVSSNETVGGTLGVTGAVTVGGTLGSTGLITATAGLTAGANQHITVSGTGQHKHGTKTLMISHTLGVNNGFASRTGYNTSPGGSSSVEFPISLEVGTRILAVRANVVDVAGASWLFTIRTLSSTGVDTTVATSGSSSGAGASQQIGVSGLTITVALLNSYYVEMIWGASGSQSGIVRSIEVDFDRP